MMGIVVRLCRARIDGQVGYQYVLGLFNGEHESLRDVIRTQRMRLWAAEERCIGHTRVQAGDPATRITKLGPQVVCVAAAFSELMRADYLVHLESRNWSCPGLQTPRTLKIQAASNTSVRAPLDASR